MTGTVLLMKMIEFNYEFYRPTTNAAIYKAFIPARGEFGLTNLLKHDVKLFQRCQNRASNTTLSTSINKKVKNGIMLVLVT